MSGAPTESYDRFRPTEELSKGPALLEASAGTGKTYTITSLVLRLVAEHRLRLPEILIVTFTRAATSELRERVRTRLIKALRSVERALADDGWEPDRDDDEVIHHLVCQGRDAGPEELRARLDALTSAREDFDEATISTIHGFCHETLHQSAFESQLDLGAELVENLSDLLEEVTHDFIVAELRHVDLHWYRYLRDNNVQRSELLALARTIELRPDLRIIPDDSGADPQQLWFEVIDRFRECWRRDSAQLVDWLCGTWEDRDITRTYTTEKIEDRRASLDAWCAGDVPPFEELGDIADTIGFFSRSTITSKLKKGRVIPVDHQLVDECERLLDLVGMPATAVKVRFATFARDELERRKQQRNILSFNDLLRKLADALTDDGAAEALRTAIRHRYRAALIDEFQDTDPVQWAIFRAAFADDWLYLIGDPKQAIYAFRGADVHEYLHAAELVGEDARYTLSVNWRSDARYVRALNHLLDQPGVFGHPDIRYIEVETADEHQDDRLEVPEGRYAPMIIRRFPREPFGKDGTSPITKKDGRPEIDRQVAAEIVEFLDSGTIIHPDREEPRPVEPRDLAVLVRLNRQAERIQRALIDAGVHAVIGGGGTVYESDEATQIQRLLDGLLTPHAEREVKAAITTPLFGVHGVDLVDMETDERRWERWIEQFARWSSLWRDDGIAEAVRTAFAEREVASRILELPDGERRMTNLLHVLELVHVAESEHAFGPTALAGWLRAQRADEQQSDEAEIRLESDEEAVKVLTIHRAKGLEFPIIWCPYLWDGELLKGGSDNLQFHHPDDGELTLDLHVDPKREPKATHKRYAAREDWEENLRILYVALTRTRHRCVVYWGPFSSAGRSPLGHVLHGSSFQEGDDGHPDAPPSSVQLDDDQIEAQLRELADGSGDTIELDDISLIDQVPTWDKRTTQATDLSARSFVRESFDRAWRRTSFTALVRPLGEQPPTEGSPAAEGQDHDQRSRSTGLPDGVGGPGLEDVPLAGLARGPRAGDFVHGVLEDLDFTQVDAPDVLDAIVDRRLARHRIGPGDRDQLLTGLRAAVRTPLGPSVGDLRLIDVAVEDRLTELSFDLPVGGGYSPAGPSAELDLRRIAEVFDRHRERSPIAGQYADHLNSWNVRRPGRGFLTGAIDLVIRHPRDGHDRYAIVDHKSNWLGQRSPDGDRCTVDHYHPRFLASEMVDHHYVLQYHLYLVALHRFLRWRLEARYDYERDVAGALYLFVRGMIGSDTPRDDRDHPHGVFADRPPRELIEDLDALLRHGTNAEARW